MQVKLLNIKDLYLRKSWFKPFLSKKQDGNRLRTGELINPIRSALSISIILSVRNRLFSSIQRLKPCIHRVYSRPLPMNFNSFHKSYTPALRNSPACIFSIKTRRNASFRSTGEELVVTPNSFGRWCQIHLAQRTKPASFSTGEIRRRRPVENRCSIRLVAISQPASSV